MDNNPETTGMGTELAVTVGLLIILFAVVLLIANLIGAIHILG